VRLPVLRNFFRPLVRTHPTGDSLNGHREHVPVGLREGSDFVGRANAGGFLLGGSVEIEGLGRRVGPANLLK